MHNNRTRTLQRHCKGGLADRRGTAIVLVLVTIVMVAILAAALLQLARFQRIPRTSSSIDAVVESVIDEILAQATDDILDNSGNLLNISFTPFNGGGDEPWDYPWTHDSKVYGRTVTDDSGTEISINGGSMDDSWLADAYPDFRTSVPPNTVGSSSGVVSTGDNVGVWRKITNLTGAYIGSNGGGNADLSLVADSTDPNFLPLTNFNAIARRDNNIPTNSNVLVDADGDGIGDSRWEWAPLRQIGTTQYVMAVRVIDLSARMNVNVAMGSTPADGSGEFSTGRPYGDSPVELDGSAFVQEMAVNAGTNATTAGTEWRNVVGFRLTANDASVLPASPGFVTYDGDAAPPTAGSRRDYWVQGASQTSASLSRNGRASGSFDYSNAAAFGFADCFELLARNGLNSSNTTALEELMPEFLRRDAGREDNFVTNPSGVTSLTWNQREFWENDPRKHITPFSGSMQVQTPSFINRPSKVKLNVNESIKTNDGLQDLRDVISETVNDCQNSGGFMRKWYQFDFNATQWANQLALNIADYADKDNLVSTHPAFGPSVAGFEALPFISELYTQRLYNATVTATEVTWDGVGAVGYVLEIGNPFARYDGGRWVGRPISLENIHIEFNGRGKVRLTDIGSMPTELKPGEVVHLYRSSAGGPINGGPDQHDLSNYAAEHGNAGNHTVIAVEADDPLLFILPGWNDYSIKLHCETETPESPGPAATTGGTIADWPYSQINATRPAQSITAAAGTVPAGTTPDGDPNYQSFITTSYQGIGQGLPMMTVDPLPQPNPDLDGSPPTSDSGYSWDRTIVKNPVLNCDLATGQAQRTMALYIGNEDKPNAPTTYDALADQQITWQDNPRDRIQYIGDILQIPIIGPIRNGNQANNETVMAYAFFKADNEGRAAPAVGDNFRVTRANEGIKALMLPIKNKDTPPSGTPVDLDWVDVSHPSRATAPVAVSFYGVFNYPPGIMLMEKLCTHNPAYDGYDGDGQSDSGGESYDSPDYDEMLIPGRINLNTVSYQTLVNLLPFPDLATRQAYATAIFERREDLRQWTKYNVGNNNIPGIMHVGALLGQLDDLAQSPSRSGNSVVNLGTPGARIDTNDYEATPGDYLTLEDGVADDREEQLMLSKWLYEMCDTRSDVFAAYIIVQGYQTGSYSSGVKESRQLVVVFSRANVHENGDRAFEVARFYYQ